MSSEASTSFILDPPTQDSDDDLDSLPSSDSQSSLDDAEFDSDAEREWRESLQQIELLLTMVVVPEKMIGGLDNESEAV
ncbi:DNA topoisomerase 1 [Venturia nashicola]|nr:DNA topoisomerase 1 [Venturia nashicola]